jgi:NodT family efflux transporter outer membrane factor (OMF) lipoprotein
MKRFNISIILFAAVLMSGCGLYSKYERPDMKTQGVIRDTVSAYDTLAVADTASFGNVAWEEVFTDPQLQTLIRTGLEHNHDLSDAVENVKIAEAQLMSARLAFLPSLTFSPNGRITKIANYDHAPSSHTYTLPLEASWSVDLFGTLLSQNRSSKVAMLMSVDRQQAVRSKVICSIANMYYTLLMLDRQLEIISDMEVLTKETWDMMKLQKELGGAKETAVVSAEASYYNAVSQGIDMRRQIRETENALSLLLGQQVQYVGRGRLEDQNLPDKFSTGLAVSLLANRPDVHAAEMNLAQCFYDIQTARSRFFPALTITATGSYTNSIGNAVVNPGKFMSVLAGSLVQPIFARGKLVAGLKVAKSKYQIAYNTWEKSFLTAGSEVSNALVKYNSSNEKGIVDRKRVEALTKSVEYTKDLYQMGSSTYLEVISAQNQLLNAEITQVTDEFNKMQAVVSLYNALGGGRK